MTLNFIHSSSNGVNRIAPLACFVVLGASLHAAEPLSLTKLIERVEPSVVRLDVRSDRGEGIGSGFVVQSDGIVVTNHHVMAGVRHAKASFSDGSEARVLGTLALDADRDIAVIKIGGGPYPALPLAASPPRKGASVVAFGAPQGLSFSATEGIVSSVRTTEELARYIEKAAGTWVQTSTPISPGNSGGPLVSIFGEVVGANTWGLVRGQNLNFAISSPDIQTAVDGARTQAVVALADGAAKIEADERSFDQLTGAALREAVRELAKMLNNEDADGLDVGQAAQLLLRIDPEQIGDAKTRGAVARAFKRVAYESRQHREEGIRGMARWGGKHAIPYLAELLEIETFNGSEAIYDVLSRSDDPIAAEAIARRLGNFFDRRRAMAALRRMGPRAEPGLIRAVPSSDFDVSLTSISLLAEYGTEASLQILSEAERKGTPAVKRAAADARRRIRIRKRREERSGAEG